MDADGSMDPAEIDVFMSMISVGFDLVKGRASRAVVVRTT